jgi:hypothetical protein
MASFPCIAVMLAVAVPLSGAQAVAPTPAALDLFRADLKAAFIATDGGPGTSGGGVILVSWWVHRRDSSFAEAR